MFLPHLSCSAIFLVLCILTSKQVLRTPFAGRNHFLSNGNGTNTHTHISCLYIKPWLVIFFVLHNFYLKNLILKVIFLLFLHRVLYQNERHRKTVFCQSAIKTSLYLFRTSLKLALERDSERESVCLLFLTLPELGEREEKSLNGLFDWH